MIPDIPYLEAALAPPILTADLPGIGGTLKNSPEDFRVIEIPAYSPSGDGDFLWLTVEKRNLAHGELLRRFRNILGLHSKEIGYAGAKDKVAITSQTITVPHHVEDQLQRLESDDLRITHVDRHEHRIRMGHLRGNTFSLIIRDTAPNAETLAQEILDAFAPTGFPNYYGEQRFGDGGKNINRGLKLLSIIDKGKKIQRSFENTIALSSVQSWLFNLAVIQRLEKNFFHAAMLGDVMKKRETGGLFVAEDVEIESQRIQAGEIIPTGPIYGRKMWWPNDDAGAFEKSVLTDVGLSEDSFAKTRKLMLGTRRPIAVLPDRVGITTDDDGALNLSFALPKGTYATVLLREIMKISTEESGESQAP